jgi:hypothetical protein
MAHRPMTSGTPEIFFHPDELEELLQGFEARDLELLVIDANVLALPKLMDTSLDGVHVEPDSTGELDGGHSDPDQVGAVARMLPAHLEQCVDDTALLIPEQHILDLIFSLAHSAYELTHQAKGELGVAANEGVEGLRLEAEHGAVGERHGRARTTAGAKERCLTEEIARAEDDEVSLDESDPLDEPDPTFLKDVNVLRWFILAIDHISSRKTPAVGLDQSLALDVV